MCSLPCRHKKKVKKQVDTQAVGKPIQIIIWSKHTSYKTVNRNRTNTHHARPADCGTRARTGCMLCSGTAYCVHCFMLVLVRQTGELKPKLNGNAGGSGPNRNRTIDGEEGPIKHNQSKHLRKFLYFIQNLGEQRSGRQTQPARPHSPGLGASPPQAMRSKG